MLLRNGIGSKSSWNYMVISRCHSSRECIQRAQRGAVMGGFETMVRKNGFKVLNSHSIEKKIGRRPINLELSLPVLLVIIQKMVINLSHVH